VRRSFCSALAGLCLLTVMPLACVLDAPYEKYAIVYGISFYDTGLPEGSGPNLTFANDDANSVAAMFTGQGYSVRLRTDTAADRTQLLADVADVASSVKDNDLFVFYFSGHGGKGGTGPESGGADSQQEWIYLYGSVAPLNPAATFNDDQLLAALGPIPCRRKVILLDSCNSGGFIGEGLEADGTPPSLLEGGQSLPETLAKAISLYANFDGSSADIPPWEALVISASGERELSYEYDSSFNHGIFTYYLLQSERSGDRNRDGYVTVTEAYDYIHTKINNEWNLKYGEPTAVFSPHVSGGPVDYVLFTAR
jgi:hypothetical protein